MTTLLWAILLIEPKSFPTYGCWVLKFDHPSELPRLCTKAKTPRLAHGATSSLVEVVRTSDSSIKSRCWGKGTSVSPRS